VLRSENAPPLALVPYRLAGAQDHLRLAAMKGVIRSRFTHDSVAISEQGSNFHWSAGGGY